MADNVIEENVINKILVKGTDYYFGSKYDSEKNIIKDTYFKKEEMPWIELVVTKAGAAITGAENVNATITEENIFEVTDRTGAKKTLDLNITGGTSASFGEIAATVDNSTGTPGVTVTTSGTNEAKNFTFAFTGLKGEKGEKGEVGMQGNSGVADVSNKTLVNDAITGGETDFLSAEVGKLGILTYDCSKGGSVTHATLQEAINSVPTTFQKVGLTITYKSGDTIHRYTLNANAWSADPVNWFSVEDKLNDLVMSLEAEFSYKGIAQPATNPGVPDRNVFYIAGEGSYPNFDNQVVEVGQIAVLKWDSSWHKEVLEIDTGGGNMILDWNTDVATTRKQVPAKERKSGMQISYKPEGENWVNEQYIGTSFTDSEWVKDTNWVPSVSQEQYSDLENKIYSKENVSDFIVGYYLPQAINPPVGGAIDLNNVSKSAGYCYQVLDVQEGNIINITYIEKNINTYYSLIDNTGLVKRVFSFQKGTLTENVSLVVKKGESKLVLQGDRSVYIQVFKLNTFSYDIISNRAAIDILNNKEKREVTDFSKFIDISVPVNSNSVYAYDYNGKCVTVHITNVHLTANNSEVYIFINDELIYTLPIENGKKPCACVLLGDFIYFVGAMPASKFDGGNTDEQKIRLYKFSLLDKTWSETNSITLTECSNTCGIVSTVLWNNTPYFCFSDANTVSGYPIKLYKIDNDEIVYVNDIATANEIWGGYGNTEETVTYRADKAFHAFLGCDNDYMYCLYNSNVLTYTPLIKRMKYNENVWKQHSISCTGIFSRSVYSLPGRSIYSDGGNDQMLLWNDYDNKEHHIAINNPDNFADMSCSCLLKYLLTDDSVNLDYSTIQRDGNNCILVFKYHTGTDATMDIRYRVCVYKTRYDTMRRLLNGMMAVEVEGKSVTNIPFNCKIRLVKEGAKICYRSINDGNSKKFYRTLGKDEEVYITNLGTESYHVKSLNAPRKKYYNKVFRAGYSENDWQSKYFRCPSIVKCLDGTLIACSNAPLAAMGDTSPISTAFAVSHDSGRTWEFKHVLDIPYLTFDGRDAALLVDDNVNSTHYGRVWAQVSFFDRTLSSINQLTLYTMYSDDNGETWSELTDITDMILPDKSNIDRFIKTLTNGIVIKGGKCDGYLVFPTWIDRGNGEIYSNIIYSADGITWNLSKDVPIKSSNEDSVVQIDDNTILISCRTISSTTEGKKMRVFYKMDISEGMDADWLPFEGDTASTQECQEGLVKYGNIYLSSRPTYGNREGITLFATKDFQSWLKIAEITGKDTDALAGGGLLGYSNISVGDGHLGVIYEGKNFDVEYCNLDSYWSIIKQLSL